MSNIIFIIFTFLILIYKKVILLNEETLILICFLTFVFLSTNSFGNALKKSLNNESNKVKLTLENSLKKAYIVLLSFVKLNKTFKNVFTKFHTLGNYYYELLSLLVYTLPVYSDRKITTAYTKRLVFLSKIEKQTAKILPIIVIKKLNKIVKLKQFYNMSVKNNYFLCLQAVSLREYIQLISFKK